MELLIEKIKSLKDIYEPLNLCMFVKDMEGRLIYMNPAFVKLTGYNYNDMMFETTDTFLKGNTIQIRESINDDHLILSGGINETSRTIFLKDRMDQDVVMRIKKAPLRYKGDIIGILGMAEDFTINYRMHWIGIKRMIMQLSCMQRLVIFQYSRGLSRAEVARSLQLELSTCDTHYQRAKEKLALPDADFKLFLRLYNDLLDNVYSD